MRFREESASLDLAILRAHCPRTPAESAAAMVSAAAGPMRDVPVNLVIDRQTLADRDSRVTGPPISAGRVSPATAQQISADPGNRAIALETSDDPVSPVIAPATSVDPDVRGWSTPTQNLPSRIADRGQWQDWRQENLGDIGDYWQNNWGDFDDWYGDSWWNDNHIDYPYYPGFGFWAGAAWSGLTAGSTMAGLTLSTTTTVRMFTTTMAMCITEISQCARSSNTLTRPRQLR